METSTTTSLDSTSKALGPDPQHPARVTPQTLTLLHDYVLVQPLAPPLKKAGGLMFMQENAGARERNSRGVVIAVGPGDYNTAGTAIVAMSIAPGDLVFFGKYAGTEEEFDGLTVLAMRETECRLSVKAGKFQVVSHENPKLNHLVEDWCDVCYGDVEAEAKARLETERERLRDANSPLRAVDGPPAFATDHVQAVDDELSAIAGVTARRPCAEPGCLYVQRLVDGSWRGLSCGHTHPAGLEA